MHGCWPAANLKKVNPIEQGGAIDTLTVLVNRGGGAAMAAGESVKGQLEQAFRDVGVRADVHLLRGGELAGAVKAAAAQRRIVVAGGDGTVACAVQARAGSGGELALIPLGTLNHFARDLAIPAEFAAAAAVAAHGEALPIDVASVNGRRFVNNASIGLYPFMVRTREGLRRRQKLPKWLAMLPAALTALARLRHHRLHIDTGAGDRTLVTPLLFVGNNAYSIEQGRLGSRASLRDGKLSVIAVAARSRAALIWFALRVLVGRVDPEHDFVVLTDCKTLTVRSSRASIRIALDGEVMRLASPLEFSIEPGALNMVVPASAQRGSAQ